MIMIYIKRYSIHYNIHMYSWDKDNQKFHFVYLFGFQIIKYQTLYLYF